MTLIYLISALTIRTQHTKQEHDKRPGRPGQASSAIVWLGQAHRASASREHPFRGTTAIFVRSSFDGASVASAYHAHIDHAARPDNNHAQRTARRAHSWSPGSGTPKQSQQISRAAHSPSALYARAIANMRLHQPARSGRRASGEPGVLKRESSPGRYRPWSAKPGDLVEGDLVTMCRRRAQRVF